MTNPAAQDVYAPLSNGAARACLSAVGGGEGEEDASAEVAIRALGLAVDPVVLVGTDRRIVFANPPALELTGFAPEEMVGRTCAGGLGFRSCGQRCALFDGCVYRRECDLVGKS
ncbi:MAG: PAS domain-containing protein, partial [Myxococcaceae bacterium]